MPDVDPYPKSLILTHLQVAKVVGVPAKQLTEFIADPEIRFPHLLKLGKNKNGKPRYGWKKSEVYAWVELRRFLQPQNMPENE